MGTSLQIITYDGSFLFSSLPVLYRGGLWDGVSSRYLAIKLMISASVVHGDQNCLSLTPAGNKHDNSDHFMSSSEYTTVAPPHG